MDIVTQFSANETRFARRKSNFFHRFVTSIFNKRSSLCLQKSNVQGVPTGFGQPNWADLGGWFMVVWVGGP